MGSVESHESDVSRVAQRISGIERDAGNGEPLWVDRLSYVIPSQWTAISIGRDPDVASGGSSRSERTSSTCGGINDLGAVGIGGASGGDGTH